MRVFILVQVFISACLLTNRVCVQRTLEHIMLLGAYFPAFPQKSV